MGSTRTNAPSLLPEVVTTMHITLGLVIILLNLIASLNQIQDDFRGLILDNTYCEMEMS